MTQTQTLYIPFASPPTPCPSPTTQIQDPRATPSPARRHYLSAFLHACTPAELIFISNIVAPLLKRDFLAALPTELAVHILAFIDDPRTLVRAGLVSRAWRRLAADEWLWRRMCNVWQFELDEGNLDAGIGVDREEEPLEEMEQYAELTMDPALEWLTARKLQARRVRLAGVMTPPASSSSSLDARMLSYKDCFKESYITSTFLILLL
jgi:F-box and WD-40 domain protein CDC4